MICHDSSVTLADISTKASCTSLEIIRKFCHFRVICNIKVKKLKQKTCGEILN